jgi:hypothetical protein
MSIAPFSLALVILIMSLIVTRSHHECSAPDLCANAAVGAHLLFVTVVLCHYGV